MNESARDAGDVQAGLVLLAASGLLPDVRSRGSWDAGAGTLDQPPPVSGGAAEGLAAGARADHRSYLPDLVAEPCWSAIEAGALLGFGPDDAPRALDWLRRSGVVIGLPRAGGIVYPRFQFDAVGRRVHPVVAVVNVWLGTAGDLYAAAVWWLRPAPGGRRPRELVGTPDERRVIDFAAAHISGRVLCPGAGRAPGVERRVIGGQVAVDTPREHPAVAAEPAHASPPAPAPIEPTPAPIEPIPRGAGVFGRHPRHA